MSKNVYKTAQGRALDIDNLRLANETTIAVGNMKVNARGDQVASDGTVTVPKETIMKNHYRLNTPWVGKKKIQPLAAEVIAATPKTNTVVTPKVETSNLVSDSGLRGALASALSKTAVIPEDEPTVDEETVEEEQPTTSTNTLKRI